MTVSVIIPTYNRLALLREAVASVLNQTGVEYELIVVDDGSTDGTAEYSDLLDRGGCSVAAAAGPRGVKTIRIEHTGMPGAARNVGARAASGRLLAFLDSDDLWASDKLRLQSNLHAQSPVEISHTRELWLRDGRTVSQKSQRHRREGYVFADAVVKCTIGPSTAMIDRQLFLRSGGFREDLDFAEDYELWLRLVWNRQVAYLDEPLTVKRAGHADQLSARYGEMERIRLEALRDLIEAGTFVGEAATLAVEELVRKCGIYAAGARKHGRSAEAEKYEAFAHFYARGRR